MLRMFNLLHHPVIRKSEKKSKNLSRDARGPSCRCDQGRNLISLRRGRRYIYNRKDGIINTSVKCVAPQFEDMSLAKVWNAGGGTPQLRPLVWRIKVGWSEGKGRLEKAPPAKKKRAWRENLDLTRSDVTEHVPRLGLACHHQAFVHHASVLDR